MSVLKILKCDSCGGKIIFTKHLGNTFLGECSYCGTDYAFEASSGSGSLSVAGQTEFDQLINIGYSWLNVQKDSQRAISSFQNAQNKDPGDYRGFWGELIARTNNFDTENFQVHLKDVSHVAKRVFNCRGSMGEDTYELLYEMWENYQTDYSSKLESKIQELTYETENISEHINFIESKVKKLEKKLKKLEWRHKKIASPFLSILFILLILILFAGINIWLILIPIILAFIDLGLIEYLSEKIKKTKEEILNFNMEKNDESVNLNNKKNEIARLKSYVV